MMSVDVPGAGGLVMGFSIWTRISALLAAWLSSLMATSSVLGSGEAMTLTGIFSLASPFSVLCLLWMFCHTVSAACLLAGDLSRQESTSSQSLKESCSTPFCVTALAASSQVVGAGLTVNPAGGAVPCAAAATISSHPSVPPWNFLYRDVRYGAMLLMAAWLF